MAYAPLEATVVAQVQPLHVARHPAAPMNSTPKLKPTGSTNGLISLADEIAIFVQVAATVICLVERAIHSPFRNSIVPRACCPSRPSRRREPVPTPTLEGWLISGPFFAWMLRTRLSAASA